VHVQCSVGESGRSRFGADDDEHVHIASTLRPEPDAVAGPVVGRNRRLVGSTRRCGRGARAAESDSLLMS
jgi:hypothetical protein